METTILLIRHAAHADLGTRLSGRQPGIALSDRGVLQARRLAQRLDDETLDGVQASPLQRAQETAAAIAAGRGLPVETCPELDEVDFGAWTGRVFADLAGDTAWDAWNGERASAAPPGGERMGDAQARAWRHLEHTAQSQPGATVAMVSHCDIIRALVLRVLDVSLNAILRFEVGPASVSRIGLGPGGARLLSLNEGAYDR